MTDAAIQPLTCDNPQTAIDPTHSPKCDSGSVKTPVNLPKLSSAVRNDEKDISKPHNRKSAFTLAEGATHVDNCANIRKSAFTLAEVLITLGVIGIVAAMTLPAVVGKFHDIQRTTALKKAYTIISQALLMSQEEHSEPNVWEFPPYHKDGMEEWANEYIIKYMKKVTSCQDGGSKKCPTEMTKICKPELPAHCYGRELWAAEYVLLDGMNLYLFSGGNPVDGKSSFVHIMIDTNGIAKPNMNGKDVFAFALELNSKNAKLRSLGNEKERERALAKCRLSSESCLNLLMLDNFEFKKDYPWHY